jgi:hypothetical protein
VTPPAEIFAAPPKRAKATRHGLRSLCDPTGTRGAPSGGSASRGVTSPHHDVIPGRLRVSMSSKTSLLRPSMPVKEPPSS